MTGAFMPRELPESLAVLADLALDVRWTWSHAGDALWQMVSPATWERTRNPWIILQDIPQERLEQLAADARFTDELQHLLYERDCYLEEHDWYRRQHGGSTLQTVAYFSMEFGLGEALPLYAGGLGILAGDYLKTASDLGVPVVGVGLLYQQGYFRQVLDANGRQQELYPYNDPTSLPIQPVLARSGGWLHVALQFPGRTLLLRVWQARVGRVPLYLLDSNDPLNSPADRGIISELYGGGPELRLVQELVLGVGGWRLLEALGLEVDVCHLNEGHAAFVALERARCCMVQQGVSFGEALYATRAGNVFTTHTPVAAGFDSFAPELIGKYFSVFQDGPASDKISLAEVLALGRRDAHDPHEPFNMAYLALRSCAAANGVSRLHGAVSRAIFRGLYARWPESEVPIGHITNGVHVPSWDSAWADALWTERCGKTRWRDTVEPLGDSIQTLTDEAIWAFRAEQRQTVVRFARRHLASQVEQRNAPPDMVAQAWHVLDPNALTLGFARRFTAYKRPNLLLHNPERLRRLLTNTVRPVQIIVAGKAHPQDEDGKRLVRAWLEFVQEPGIRSRAVFLEDYDMALAQELVQGVDVWINTPRRPWEACGTSGMKVLVNGGLNLSELDGWWAEAYDAKVGWALGDGREHPEPEWDSREAEALYDLLEREVVPAFYTRDAQGIPRAWVARIRASMADLAPQFSSNRMVRDYVEQRYLPAAAALRRRTAQGGQLAKELYAWQRTLEGHWHEVHFGNLDIGQAQDRWTFRVPVYLGEVAPSWVRVELYADGLDGEEPLRQAMQPGDRITGAVNGYVYHATVPASRPAWHFTPRIIPYHPEAHVPLEATLILWQR